MSEDNKNPFGEKTVVQSSRTPSQPAESLFDARTVVHSSKPSGLPKVLAVDLPAAAPSIEAKDETTELKAERRLSRSERRAARAAIDRKTRIAVASFSAICVMAVLIFVAASPNGKTTAKNETTSSSQSLASEGTDLTPGLKKAQALTAEGAIKTTTEVLSEFDQAAKRAQDHALESSR